MTLKSFIFLSANHQEGAKTKALYCSIWRIKYYKRVKYNLLRPNTFIGPYRYYHYRYYSSRI